MLPHALPKHFLSEKSLPKDVLAKAQCGTLPGLSHAAALLFQAVDVMPQPSLGSRRLGGSQVVVVKVSPRYV